MKMIRSIHVDSILAGQDAAKESIFAVGIEHC